MGGGDDARRGDAYGVGFTSAGACEWRRNWDARVVEEGSLDPHRSSGKMPQAIAPRTTRPPGGAAAGDAAAASAPPSRYALLRSKLAAYIAARPADAFSQMKQRGARQRGGAGEAIVLEPPGQPEFPASFRVQRDPVFPQPPRGEPAAAGGLVRGRMPRWRTAPAEQRETRTEIEVWPSEAPATTPDECKWVWITEWRPADVAEVLREQASSFPYNRERGVTLTLGVANEARRDCLPAVVLDGVKAAIRDASHNVRLAAAITMVTLAIPDDVACAIVYNSVEHGTPEMKWRAARCLASVDVCSIAIAKVLLGHITRRGQSAERDEAKRLAVALSKQSKLVFALTAELLNSTDPTARLEAVRLLPQLHGLVSRDCADKLLSVMWDDNATEIRQAAALALGITGNGALVHDDLVDRLENGNERTRVEVLCKLASMRRLTPRLAPIFHARFHDSCVALLSPQLPRTRLTAPPGTWRCGSRPVTRRLCCGLCSPPPWSVCWARWPRTTARWCAWRPSRPSPPSSSRPTPSSTSCGGQFRSVWRGPRLAGVTRR